MTGVQTCALPISSLLLAYRIAVLFGVTVEKLYCLEENLRLEEEKYEDLS